MMEPKTNYAELWHSDSTLTQEDLNEWERLKKLTFWGIWRVGTWWFHAEYDTREKAEEELAYLRELGCIDELKIESRDGATGWIVWPIDYRFLPNYPKEIGDG